MQFTQADWVLTAERETETKSRLVNVYTNWFDPLASPPSSYVTINPTLCDCLLEKSEYQEVDALKWDDLFSR